MKKQMAIEELKALRKDDKRVYAEEYEALEVAIQALEEIQQYRAIGTVEELQMAMKYVSLAKKHGTVGKAIDACAEYESIGTVEELQALKEKSVAKKPIIHDFKNGTVNYGCPICKRKIISKIDGEWCAGSFQEYCDRCGQHLDWE